MISDLPSLHWGILTTGLISSWFVGDILLSRPEAKATHTVAAIATSTAEKGDALAEKHICKSSPQPKIYTNYADLYNDPNVDIVYVGTPHAFHRRNCLDAIAAGKHVLCEKPFTMNAREAREVLAAAKTRGVYVAEAMWLRHRPLVLKLQEMLHREKAIGEVFRSQSNFGLLIDVPNLPPTSRYRDLKLGAGTLLDIGIYPLTWGILALDPKTPGESEVPKVLAVQSFDVGVEVSSSVLLQYPSTGRQGIVSSTTMAVGDPEIVCRIEGTQGYIEVEGDVPSLPRSFTLYPRREGDPNQGSSVTRSEGKKYEFKKVGMGFVYEADDAAVDIQAGRTESSIMPWGETVRVMELLDEIRRQGGTVYEQDLVSSDGCWID